LGLTWPALEELISKRRDLKDRLSKAGARAWQLENEELRTAKNQDATLYAGVILSGSPKGKAPAPKHEAEVRRELEEALRERGALQVALREVDADLETLVDESAPAWAEEVARACDDAASSYSYAIEHLLERRARYFALRRLHRYLEHPGAPTKRIAADHQPPVIKTTQGGLFREQQDLNQIAALLRAELERS
jgi:hypothetical protein